MTFESDVDQYRERLVLLNNKYKIMEERISELEVASKSPVNDDLISRVDDHVKQLARRTFNELNGASVEMLAKVACDNKFAEYAADLISKSGMVDWLEENLSGYVDNELDNLMCEKTQRTIEEYSLVNHSELSERVSEEMSSHGYVTEDTIDDKSYELKSEVEDMITEAAKSTTEISEIAAEAIGEWLENSDLYNDITAHVKSKMILSQVVNDAQCLNRVKRDLERSGVLNESGEIAKKES